MFKWLLALQTATMHTRQCSPVQGWVSMTNPTRLRTVIGRYPRTAAFIDGQTNGGALDLQFIEVNPLIAAFKPMVRELAFDVCEMALATFLMARDRNVPLRLIPATLVSRHHHPSLLCHVDGGLRGPEDLIGRRVGVRSYSQTSGVWLRGILQNDHGIDIRKIRWVTFEDTHVAGFTDPEWAERAPPNSNLAQMAVTGVLDAVIADLPPDPRLRPVLSDPVRLAEEWTARHAVVPISHMVVLKNHPAVDHTGLPEELHRQLLLSRDMAGLGRTDGQFPFGSAETAATLCLLARYAFQQGLVSHPYEPQELMD